MIWQLSRLSGPFSLLFISGCHPVRWLSHCSCTNPTGHYEAGLIPATVAREAFQGGFPGMTPCLSHASVGFWQDDSVLLWSHSIINVCSYPQSTKTNVLDVLLPKINHMMLLICCLRSVDSPIRLWSLHTLSLIIPFWCLDYVGQNNVKKNKKICSSIASLRLLWFKVTFWQKWKSPLVIYESALCKQTDKGPSILWLIPMLSGRFIAVFLCLNRLLSKMAGITKCVLHSFL